MADPTLTDVLNEHGSIVEMSLSTDPSKTSIKVDGKPLGLVTHVRVEMDAKEGIPRVTFELIPRQLIVRSDGEIVTNIPTTYSRLITDPPEKT